MGDLRYNIGSCVRDQSRRSGEAEKATDLSKLSGQEGCVSSASLLGYCNTRRRSAEVIGNVLNAEAAIQSRISCTRF